MKKIQKLGMERFIPQGKTGWKWPKVNIRFEDDEIRKQIQKRMTPVFIDGLHVRKGTTFAGVHSGYRKNDKEISLKRIPINHYPKGPSERTPEIDYFSQKINNIDSNFRNKELLFNSLDTWMGKNISLILPIIKKIEPGLLSLYQIH